MDVHPDDMDPDDMDPDDIDPARYFPPASTACPTFVADSEWQPIIDGASYLPALSALLDRAGHGDTVSIAGLEFDPQLDLDGLKSGDTGYRPLGQRLAQLVEDGVDVRVLIANRALAASLPGMLGTFFGGFRSTAKNAELMRSLRVTPTGSEPLARRVVLDFSGAFLGSNHQKTVVAHVGGELVAFIGGIDLVTDRFDADPHDRLRLDGARWGWHDAAVCIRGRAAQQAWEALRIRWTEAATLPPRRYLRRPWQPVPLNVADPVPPPGPAPAPTVIDNPGVSMRVLRSAHRRKIEPLLPWHAVPWDVQPATGLQEVFETLCFAICAARRYIYIEDQYLGESVGGSAEFELYPALRDAAARGVKIVLVGSGTRDPEDAGAHASSINREVNSDLWRKLVAPLDAVHRGNVAVYRVEHVTVHSKVVLIDDVFGCIGSANMFSRSMAGTDCELSAAVATSTPVVRDLRVALWAEHLRAPVTDLLRPALDDLDAALGMWRPEWSTDGDRLRWRVPGRPAGFAPDEQVLSLVGP